MATSRAFCYNPTSSLIPNTEQVGDIAAASGSVTIDPSQEWWNGPDEDPGYVIAYVDPSGNRPNSTERVLSVETTCHIGFFRTGVKTEEDFVNLSKIVTGSQSLSTGAQSKTYLNSLGYWTSYSGVDLVNATYSFFMIGGFETFGESYIEDYSIIRINTDGTKDTSFDNQNKFDVSSDFRLSRQTPDGNILTVSTSLVNHEGTSSRVHLIDSNGDRVNSSGFYDSYQFPLGIWSGLNDIVWDTNVGSTHSGKFYVGFNSAGVTAGGHTVSRIARYNSDYTIDTTFNTYLSSTQSGFNSSVNVIKILSDGNILVCGQFTQYKGSALTSNYICKLDKDGNLISSFNTGGAGPNSAIRCVEEDSSGNIYIGGPWDGFNGFVNSSVARLVKLNSSGTRNVSFNSQYVAGSVIQIIFDPNDGNIFVCNTSGIDRGICKILSSSGLASGSWSAAKDYWDTSSSSIPFTSKMIFASASNSLYVFGGSSYGSDAVNNMFKLNGTTGVIDLSFGRDSRLYSGAVRDGFLDSSGKIIIVGSFTQFKTLNYNAAKISPTGTVDNSFNAYPSSVPTNVISDQKGNYFIWNITNSWEKLLYANGGPTNYDAIPNNGNPSGVIKITSTGSYDTAYVPRINALSGTVQTVDIDHSRYQLYIGGNFTRTAHLILNSGTLIPKICRVSATSGVIDGTFNTTYSPTSPGFRTLIPGTEGSNANPYVYAIKYDSTIDKIYCGGNFGGYNGLTASKIIRLTSTGSYDQSFQVYTSSTQSGFGAGNVLNIQVDRTGGAHDGKIYCGGSFTSYKGVTQNRILRLNTDGSLDTSFSIGTGFNGQVNKIIVIPDGKIFILTGSSTYNGASISNGNSTTNICRLNTDGTLDTSFDVGVGFEFTGLSDTVTSYTGNANIRNIRYDSSDKLYAMGNFGKYRGEAKNCIVRINMDGTIDSTFNDGGYGAQQVSNGGIYDLAFSVQ